MMNEEMITKAKEAKSVEELIALAKENGIELTEEDAKMYFEQLSAKKGELSDDELESVSGGGCHNRDGRLIVTVDHLCNYFHCSRCNQTDFGEYVLNYVGHYCTRGFFYSVGCEDCKHMSYEKGLWLCNHPANRK